MQWTLLYSIKFVDIGAMLYQELCERCKVIEANVEESCPLVGHLLFYVDFVFVFVQDVVYYRMPAFPTRNHEWRLLRLVHIVEVGLWVCIHYVLE